MKINFGGGVLRFQLKPIILFQQDPVNMTQLWGAEEFNVYGVRICDVDQ